MDKRRFTFWHRIVATAVLVIAAVTYLSTIEPTASFWDCGEFIASSYKLEVGHPPGNPVFQLVARVFSMFAGPEHAAVAVNAMSALCSALTIFFLYLTIVFFAKRLFRARDGRWTTGQAVAIMGSGAVGALAYCFSDTFWFSAVEGEVYAMSSLFTAMVVWAMLKWYEQADQPHSNRWIVLIAFLMGLSIGVHLLNLLAIPALVFLYFYRKREHDRYTLWEYVKIFLISVVILALVLFVIVPWVPKLAAYTDLLFVNTFGLPVNSGAAFFIVALLVLCFWGVSVLYKKDRVFWTTSLMCFTSIVVGFSIFSIVIIRSSVMPPTNENQPDNAFALGKYLSREQYGSTPLVYGQYFGAPYDDLFTRDYYAFIDGKYKKVTGPLDAEYASEGKMLFPRMWSNQSDSHIRFYQSYMDGKGTTVPGAKYKKPSFGTNLVFFFDYQINWMYWRYFMWNFVGRQNDIHSPAPGNIFYGNWESGVRFIDEMRLGDQSEAPECLAGNKGKNHYFFLPLILGLLGLFFQFDRDRRGCWVTFLLFFMTGIAIVVYLNQPPYQVRERDYAYAGSFYAFSIWIGLAVAALYGWITSKMSRGHLAAASTVTLLCLFVPALMAQQNWDDHDRSNRYTSVEMAKNYLNAVGPDGILITHGDNDTFPLWYAQEVEGVRPDVRIVNTSLLGTDWHIEQMRYAINESAPLPLQVPKSQYLYGTNELVQIVDTRDQVIPLADVMAVFRHPDAKIILEDGTRADYIMSRRFSIPVNKENVLKYGILPQEYADSIPDRIVMEIPKDKHYISKPELFMLDLLSNYDWSRPISMLSMGADLNVGQKSYLMYDGFSYHLVPIKNTISSAGRNLGKVDMEGLLDKMENSYCWDALSRKDYFVDYQNLYTFIGVIPQRDIFLNMANLLIDRGRMDEAVAMLDRCQECVPAENFPLESICLGFYPNDVTVLGMVDAYYAAGAKEKAEELASRFAGEILTSAKFFADFYDYGQDNFELCCNCIYYLSDVYNRNGSKEMAQALLEGFQSLFPEQ